MSIDKDKFKELAIVVGAMLAALCVIFPDLFIKGEILSPGGLLFSYSPWRGTINPPRGLETNGILSDQFDSIIPQLIYLRERLLAGELPLYTDRIQNGVPFLFVVRHNLLVLPLIISVIVFGAGWGITVYTVGFGLLGGICFYYYCRSIEISKHAAIAAMLVYSFNTYAMQSLGFQMYLQYTLLPVGLLAVEKIIKRSSIPWMLIFIAAIQLWCVAGYPFVSAFCYYFLGFYILVRIFGIGKNPWRLFFTFLGLGLIGLMLCAPALAGSVDFFAGYDWTHRHRNWASHFRPLNLITYFVPFFYGSPFKPIYPFNWHKDCLYFGVLPALVFLFTLVGSFKSSVRIFYLLFAVWLASICYDLGGILEAVYRHIPIFKSAYPEHQRHLLAVVITVLVAFGLDDLFCKRTGLWSKLIGTLTVLAVFGWGFNYWSNFYQEREVSPVLLEHLPILTSVALLSLGAILFLLFSKRGQSYCTFLVLPLICFDLQYVVRDYNPSIPPEAFYPTTAGIDFLAQNTGEHKLLLLDRMFLANTPLAYDLRTIAGRGFFSQRQQNTYKVINSNAFDSHKTQYFFPFSKDTRLSSEFIDALGVKYVIAPAGKEPQDLPYGSSAQEREFVLRQKEWNNQIALRPGDLLSQRFRVNQITQVDFLNVYLAKNLLPKTARLKVTIEGRGLEVKQRLKLLPGRSTRYQFVFNNLKLLPLQDYRLTLSLGDNAQGDIEFYIAKGANPLRSGELSLNGEIIDGDLRFELLKNNLASEAVRLKQSETHLRDYKVVYNDDLAVWENTNVFPRAWLVGRVEYATEEEMLVKFSAEQGDLANTAWVEADSFAPDLKPNAALSDFSRRVEIVKFSETHQEFNVSSSEPAMLVTGDNFDPGWQVNVNGELKKLHRVNYTMRGVLVPAGDSVVVFKYRPTYLLPSLAIVLLGLVLVPVLLRFAKAKQP